MVTVTFADSSVTLGVNDGSGHTGTSNTFTVAPGAAVSLAVSPVSATITAGSSQTYTATASDAYSNTWNVTSSATWSISSGAGGSWSSNVYTSAAVGSWTVTAEYSGVQGTAQLIVNAVLVAPTISPSPGTVDQGQTSSLTSSAATTGTSPYTYQWFSKTPGASSYSPISDASSSSYNFVTSASTTTGTWSFELQVTDATNAKVTSTAASVTVNSALVTPTVSASPSAVDQGQTSVLNSASVKTGTGPYTYQWLEEAPGATSYSSISGATSTSYSLVTTGSTNTGNWSFELKVTDAVLSLSSSNSTSITVNSVPTVTVSPASVSLDVGQAQIFTATPSGGDGSYTGYQWYVDGTAQTGQTASTFSYDAASAGSNSITVTVTDNLNATSAQSGTASITASVLESPTPTPTSAPTATPKPTATPTATASPMPSATPALTPKATTAASGFGTVDWLIVVLVTIIVVILITLVWYRQSHKPKILKTQ